jgi:hypothetical protein
MTYTYRVYQLVWWPIQIKDFDRRLDHHELLDDLRVKGVDVCVPQLESCKIASKLLSNHVIEVTLLVHAEVGKTLGSVHQLICCLGIVVALNADLSKLVNVCYELSGIGGQKARQIGSVGEQSRSARHPDHQWLVRIESETEGIVEAELLWYHEEGQTAHDNKKKDGPTEVRPDIDSLVVARSDRLASTATRVVVDSIATLDVFIVDLLALGLCFGSCAYVLFQVLLCLCKFFNACVFKFCYTDLHVDNRLTGSFLNIIQFFTCPVLCIANGHRCVLIGALSTLQRPLQIRGVLIDAYIDRFRIQRLWQFDLILVDRVLNVAHLRL